MYLLINNTRYTCSKRIRKAQYIRYLTVTPDVDPDGVTGKIGMYRDDGFLLCEDDADSYQRKLYSGTLLTLTNEPEEEPLTLLDDTESVVVVQEPTVEDDLMAMSIDHEYRLSLLEMGLTED